MICERCKLKKICKNYDYLIEHDELTISDCSFIQSEGPYKFLNNLVDLNKQNETKESFKPKIIKPVEDAEEPEDKVVKCPNCGGNTFESDIKECDKCHKKICPNCGTDITNIVGDGEDIATIFLCNECNGIDESVEAYDSSMSFMDLLDQLDLDKEDE